MTQSAVKWSGLLPLSIAAMTSSGNSIVANSSSDAKVFFRCTISTRNESLESDSG